ncbi:hypothetical protein O6P43_031974 [Quillaja saponaria]|uniref:Uncharacterized protein n=1 Tax=Quillaja saponaria TaxID=32244 RepID=A0AAD7P979_QUISA|nr:hypothetical protein O6P43_031974 [Quillaja saponaria]
MSITFSRSEQKSSIYLYVSCVGPEGYKCLLVAWLRALAYLLDWQFHSSLFSWLFVCVSMANCCGSLLGPPATAVKTILVLFCVAKSCLPCLKLELFRASFLRDSSCVWIGAS